jgi:phosphoribosylformimino-5-aminoimidazole carboxamide ribotide isomerase
VWYSPFRKRFRFSASAFADLRCLQGTNRALYERLNAAFSMDIVASGGVSSLEDLRALRSAGLYGAILGKAYYTGAVDLKEALEASE